MRRTLIVISLCSALLAPAQAALASPPDEPSSTGECAAEEGAARKGKPSDPSHSYPFPCPEPPGFR